MCMYQNKSSKITPKKKQFEEPNKVSVSPNHGYIYIYMEIYQCAYLSLLIAYLWMIYEPFIVNGVIKPKSKWINPLLSKSIRIVL